MAHANSSNSATESGRDRSSRGQSAAGRGRGSTTRTKTRHQSSDGRGGLGSGGRDNAISSAADRSQQKSKGGRGGCSTRNQQHPRQQQKKRERSLRRIKQFTSDFASMHAECQAARYKVHRPGCKCSKMKTVRERLKSTESDNDYEFPLLLHGLVVLPDIKSIDSVYLCLDTDVTAFSNDPKEAELKLRGELFSEDDPNSGYLDQKNTSSQPYKVSCAQCLLIDKPNGFVCVSSPSTQTVAVARDIALKRIRYKKEENIPLHADHAEHLVVISRKILWQLSTARTRDQINKANYSLVDSLNRQGISDLEDQQIELGHHLASLLHITKKDPDADSTLWLVMMQWSGKKWNIDLPGGKRHLGESSFEGAVRECEEECSLTIDASWVHGEPRRSIRKADEANLYYMLRPPSDMMMESLESNSFWHENGFCKEPALKD
mmetsp:Transcript_32569/g.65950  ORF Transcript_32569/g.65950 Transcript_32569/m.65950 type:complete len:434 (+) Transcript_32569:152-1453(+)